MDKTIELAREAGADTLMYWDIEKLKRFEALVRAEERNSWPAEMEAMERQVNILTDALAAEREACADVVESTPWSDWFRTDCAIAIRARGNT
jgi:hypothetical protein